MKNHYSGRIIYTSSTGGTRHGTGSLQVGAMDATAGTLQLGAKGAAAGGPFFFIFKLPRRPSSPHSLSG